MITGDVYKMNQLAYHVLVGLLLSCDNCHELKYTRFFNNAFAIRMTLFSKLNRDMLIIGDVYKIDQLTYNACICTGRSAFIM